MEELLEDLLDATQDSFNTDIQEVDYVYLKELFKYILKDKVKL